MKKMSSISIMPLYYSLNVALIQTPISKCVADPWNMWMILSSSEIKPQTKRMPEHWGAAVRRVCAPGAATHSAGWSGLPSASYFLSSHLSPKEFLKLH